MSAGADDTLHRLWFELEHLQELLRWGGGARLGLRTFDSIGRPHEEEHVGLLQWPAYLSRVERVRTALRDSGPKAQEIARHTLAGIDLSDIWHVLVEACKEVALIYGGSVLAGTVIGGVGGAFFGGVGAIPGAAGGAAAGAQVGAWVLALLGLKSLVEGLGDAIPTAMQHYERGLREAWGPTPQDRRTYPGGLLPHEGRVDKAADELAHGHVMLIAAMLAALLAYLTRGRDKGALLKEIRNSPRLGPKVADWVVKNEGKLVEHPALKPRPAATGGTSARMNPQKEPTVIPKKTPQPQSSITPGADRVVKYGPMNPGPLSPDVANTFRSGSYSGRTLQHEQTLYRVISKDGNPAGSYWTPVKPAGPLQSVIDSALDQNWGNTATRVVVAKVPAGTAVYEGVAAAQRGLIGGGAQIYIPKVDPSWIVP